MTISDSSKFGLKAFKTALFSAGKSPMPERKVGLPSSCKSLN